MKITTSGLVESATELDRASRLVIGSIAALMIADKLEGGRPAAEAQLWTSASARYPNYFGWLDTLTSAEIVTLNGVLDHLGRDVTYTGLDPAVVSHVYETALVSEASRRDLGIFYSLGARLVCAS